MQTFRKIVLSLTFFCFGAHSYAQYFNFVDQNDSLLGTPLRLQVFEGYCCINSILNIQGQSSSGSYVSTISKPLNFDRFFVVGVASTRNGVFMDEFDTFISGSSDSGFGFAKLDWRTGESEFFDYPSPDGSTQVGAAAFDPPYTYSATTVAETLDRENLLLRKVNIENGALESEFLVFGPDIIRPFCYEIISQEETLLLSSTVGYEGQNGSYDHLIKIDLEGNLVWEHRGSKRLVDGGASKIYITELSDGNIVQVHKDDKEGNIEYFLNGWTPKPSLLRWFSPEGQILKEVHLLAGRKDRLDINQLETGSGDYFFAYGNVSIDLGDDIEDDEDGVGLITKYSNEGDTIWSRQYRHPDYDTPNNYHFILDVEELPDGDLLVLGAITPESGGLFTWLFRVNQHGCFGDSDCEDIVISKIAVVDEDNFLLYPNPSDRLLHIVLPDGDEAKSVEILTMAGRQLSLANYSSTIDISELTAGTYVCRLLFADGSALSQQFSKF